jgi:hypothetical protein
LAGLRFCGIRLRAPTLNVAGKLEAKDCGKL